MKYLLYGANGYTASLIIEMTSEFGLTPILAGRTASKLEPIAKASGFESRVFGLDDIDLVDRNLEDVDVVLHCAGPFIYTAKPMMEACIRTKTHYLDITGEIDVFEMGHEFDQQAKDAGILIMPGVGFDVVPTDSVAGYLKEKMPDASHLMLAFAQAGGSTSHGTAKTMVENLGKGGMIRKNGVLTKVPSAYKSQKIDFGVFQRHAVTIPWGDVSTSYHHTGIPNIEAYISMPPNVIKMMKFQRNLEWLMRMGFVKNYLKRKIDKRPAGPDEQSRKTASMYVYGKVTNDAGDRLEYRIKTPEGYTLTAWMGLNITKKVLEGKSSPGFHTPAGLFGHKLVFEMPGVETVG
ncbi:MAG: saccharopine dehydrogenase NADP-binding domain-containing protein [Bacteroidota bacterium]